MNRFSLTALLLIGILCLAAVLAAQEAPKPKLTKASVGPPPEMQQIAGLEGTWDVVRRTTWDSTKPPLENTAVCVNTMILSGCAMERTITSRLGNMAYEGKGTISYHQGLKAWQYTWLDNTGGLLSHYQGSMTNGTLVVSGEDVTPIRSVWTRISIFNITGTRYEEKVESSRDGGKTWRAVASSVYTKR
ncbi:MAG: DUF1579 domain-containing protein [candidate division Zixibacteria bacterium]|nr:DUF1579 domain-containing protein [candidate division Zixibacteria bacterium]